MADGALAARLSADAVTDLAWLPLTAAPQPGDLWAGRVIRRQGEGGFVDLGGAPAGWVKRLGDAAEGARLALRVAMAAFGEKGPRLTVETATASSPGPLERATPAARAAALWPGADRVRVDAADWTERRALFADARIADALEIAAAPSHDLEGGGAVRFHPTPALLAVDVDGRGADRAITNRHALAAVFRALRLKAVGGLVVIDLIDAPRHGRAAKAEAAALLAAARALAAEDPGQLRLGQISPLWLLDAARARLGAPLADLPDVALAARAALRAARGQAEAAPGRRIALRSGSALAQALTAIYAPDVARAEAAIGARLTMAGVDGAAPLWFDAYAA